MLLTPYQKWSNYAVADTNENDENKRIRFVNICSLLILHLILIFVSINLLFLSFGNNHNTPLLNSKDFIAQILTGFCFFTVLICNKHQQTKLAKLLFLLGLYINMAAYATWIFPGKLTEYFLIFPPCLALGMYKKNTIALVLLLLSLLLFHISIYNLDSYTSTTLHQFVTSNNLRFFVMIYLLMRYFKKLNQKNELLLELEKNNVIKDKILLEKQEAELRELNQFKSHFFVNLSHEIRTPLTLVQGYNNQLNKSELSIEQKEKLSGITEQVTKMKTILDAILNLSKIDEKEFQLHLEPTNLNELISKTFSNFQSLFLEKKLATTIHLPTTDLFLQLDVHYFEKALENLLSNALKFTENHNTISVTLTQNSTTIVIAVTDTGIGIPQEELSRIFNRFYQIENKVTQTQGSGIGLSFTKNIVEAHGFEILATSNKQETCFSIVIPSSAFIPTEKEKNEIPKTILQKQKPTLLIVDDHHQMRNYIASVLKEYQIITADNGQHALEQLEKYTIDLILTDYMMPVMDGETFVKTLKEQQITTPIIVLTARMDTSAKLNMLRLGIDSYLHKPFVEEELLLQIKNALKLHQAMIDQKMDLNAKEKKAMTTVNEKFQKRLETYILKNIHSFAFGVEDVAEHMGVSRRTLDRKTKALLGQTTNHLILEIRLQTARKILREHPEKNKKEIAARVGFKNGTYLFEKLTERFGKEVV